MREVAVLGVGMIPWGELWEKSLRKMTTEAGLAALDDAGVEKIDALYVGCMSSGLFIGQEHLGCVVADYLGQTPVAATRVESACASGGAALRQGLLHILSGLADVVLAVGVEKMTDVSGDGATFALATAADQEYEVYQGATFPALYALMARDHMERYGTTQEQLAMVAVKNHRHGAMNPLAQFQAEVTVDQVLGSILIADPLHILDCSPITDGAAAVVLGTVEHARKLGKSPIVRVAGSGQATDTISLCHREELSWLSATAEAASQAYRMAGCTSDDVDFAEVHDCFTIAEIMATEALGLVPKGKGGVAVEQGETALGGRIPINPSGGLKSKGHPVGATGVAQAVEAVKQLRNEAGKRQVQGARVALTQNMGGTGGSAVVHVFERLE
jgi:acetyl-CoA C-acetyltransferase